jgi:dephospho-CoA kinase
MLIGLTGNIACGKSTVTNILSELGCYTIDADKVGHGMMEKGKIVYDQIVYYFGTEILNEDEDIDRKKLGAIVFNDKSKMQVLNAITHPVIRREIKHEIATGKHDLGHEFIVLDSALLFETGWDKMVDTIWVVSVDIQTQIQRLMKRNNLTLEEAVMRISSQMALKDKVKNANVVIDNTGTIDQTRQQVEKQFKKLKKEYENEI